MTVEHDLADVAASGRALRRSEARLRAMFDHSRDALLIATPDGGVRMANPAACRLFDRSEAELRAVGWRRVVDPADARLRLAVDDLRRTGATHRELRALRRDGSSFPAEVTATAFEVEAGELLTSIVVRDASERERAAQALRESEERFRALSDAASEAVVIHDDGVILEVNRAFAELFGYGREQAVGRRALEFVAPESRSLVARAARADSAGPYEAVGLRADGTRLTLELSGRGIAYAGRRARVLTIRDVTWRKRAEEELRESREMLADLFANANDLIQSVRPDGSLEYANAAWCRTLGYEPSEIRHLDVLDVIAPEERRHCRELLRRVFAGWRGPVQTVFMTRDGRRIPVEGNVNCRMRDGHAVATRGFFRDVSERRQIEEERERLLRAEKRARRALTQQNRRLRELDELKDELVSTVSHELRTPLTSIRGFLGLLLDGDAGALTADQRRYLEIADASSQLLLRTVRDLLQLARLDTEGVWLARAPLDVNAPAERVVEELASAASRAGMELRLVAGAAPPIRADADAIRRLLENLVGNALKFGAAGHRVTIRTGARAGDAFVAVENVGTPIPKDEQQRIFTRFVRGSNALDRQIGGSGLGLAIVKAIADAHGGTVTVDSDASSTAFTVTVPAAG